MKKKKNGKVKVEENHFNKLPREFIEAIFSLTTPRDVCRLAAVSSDFKSAAKSDHVWERFLPSNIKKLISKFSPSLLSLSSKKELFFNLCNNPILLGCGNRSLALDKSSGKKRYMLGARYLDMLTESKSSDWKWRSFHGSRFAEVAEFPDVTDIRITGALITSDLSPKTLYGAYFVFKFIEHYSASFRLSALQVTCEIKYTLVKVVGRGGGSSGFTGRSSFSWSVFDVDDDEHFPKVRRDGWMEIEMGHFFYDVGQDPRSEAVKMCLVSFTNYRKSGIIVEGIEVRPIAS